MYVNNDIDYLKFLKNKKVYIWGCGVMGLKGLAHLTKAGVNVVAFCDNDLSKQNQQVHNLPVLSLEKFVEYNNPKSIVIICSSYEREIKQQLLDADIYNFISISQIDFGGGEEHYDEEYYKYQQKIGEFGGKIKSTIFKPHIKENMVVLEFGAGGGYLLENICAKEKLGIEINDTARKSASERGINMVKTIDEVPNEWADIIISTSVLEHVENPLEALRELRKKLKDGGKVVFTVPNESCETEYCRSEINNHLYTWNCLNLGNLFKAAGYFVYSVQRVQRMWPKNYFDIEKAVSPELFEYICEMGGKVNDINHCIIVAYK